MPRSPSPGVPGARVARHSDHHRAQNGRTARPPVWLRRPLAAGLLLLALYVALSFANDPKGSLGTDTGGKVATLRDDGRARAARPRHRLLGRAVGPRRRSTPSTTRRTSASVGERHDVAARCYVGLPLFRLGGYRLALLVADARGGCGRVRGRARWPVALAMATAGPRSGSSVSPRRLPCMPSTSGSTPSASRSMAWARWRCSTPSTGRRAPRRARCRRLLRRRRDDAHRSARLCRGAAAWRMRVVLAERRTAGVPLATGPCCSWWRMAVPLLATRRSRRATLHGSVRSSRASRCRERSLRRGGAERRKAVLTFTGMTAEPLGAGRTSRGCVCSGCSSSSVGPR